MLNRLGGNMSNNILVIKRLMRSDLGWFSACRTTKVTKAKQNGLNIDSKFINEIFKDREVSLKIPVEVICWEKDGNSNTKMNTFIRLQGKNWRLTGKVEGSKFSKLQPGDFILMFFDLDKDIVRINWMVASCNNEMGTIDLYTYIKSTIKENSIISDSSMKEAIFDRLKNTNLDFYQWLINSETARAQVKKAFSSRHILADIMSTVATLSSKTQIEYLKILENIVERFRFLLRDKIKSVKINHSSTWKSVKGKKVGFIDGGVASISSLGSEPIAIRVGQYTVRPGVSGEERETFDFKAQLVNELYETDNSIFDDYSDNFSKLLDMARIFTEAGAVYNSINEAKPCDILFLHGPLVNPVAPYADYPNFTDHALEMFGLSDDILKEKINPPPSKEKHFISSYSYLLNSIFESEIPVCGIVERSTSSRIVSLSLLEDLSKRGFENEAKEIREAMRDNRITDAILFSCLLKEGEYINLQPIDKNSIGKSPDIWKSVIENYQQPLTTYLKVTDTSYPFRIEINRVTKRDENELIQFIFHMARLLPQYAFPVGLDIVDKFAKMPAWMTKQITREQSAQILNTAIMSGNTDVVDLVRLYLSGNTRDWLFRPKTER